MIGPTIDLISKIKILLVFSIFLFYGQVTFAENRCEKSYWLKTFTPLLEKAQNPWDRLCQDLNLLMVGKPTRYQPICANLWVNGPRWIKRPVQKTNKTLNKARVMSKAEMYKLGYSYLTPDDLKSEQSYFEQKKNSISLQCCGDSSKCSEALSRVTLKYCTNEAAEKNPDLPDECTKVNTHFSYSADEIREYRNNLQKPSSENFKVTFGYVNMEKYVNKKDGNYLYFRQFSLNHELWHACQGIRFQLDAREKKIPSSWDLLVNDFENLCRENKSDYMFNLLRQMTGSDQYGSCILKSIEEESQNKNFNSYQPNSCWGSKLIEGFATTGALLSIEANGKRKLDYCNSEPNATHLTPYLVIDCLLKYVPSFRNNVYREAECPVQ